jgi:uncharacterized protein YqhQ
MMRSPSWVATAVQRASGEITLERTPFQSITRRVRVLGLPVVRGVAGMVETLRLGMQSLSFSANEAALDEKKPGAEASKGISSWSLTLTMVVSFALGLLVFFYLPLKLTEWVGATGRITFNLVDGVFRLAIFLAYLWGISRWREMAGSSSTTGRGARSYTPSRPASRDAEAARPSPPCTPWHRSPSWC